VRLLYLVDPGPDYLADQLYTGLCNVLGREAVWDYPWKPVYHEPAAKIWYLPQRPGPRRTSEEVLEALAGRAFDLVCLSSPRAAAVGALEALLGKVPLPPLVFVDGEDDARIRHEVLRRFPVALHFKRDYVWGAGSRRTGWLAWAVPFRGDRGLFARTHPLPLAAVLEAIPPTDSLPKTIDVSYTGRVSHIRRVRAVKILQGLPGVTFAGGVYGAPEDRPYNFETSWPRRLFSKATDRSSCPRGFQELKLQPADYYRQIAMSKVALSIRGGGMTPPPRYYEIVACRSLLLSDPPETVIPNNFEHRRHAVFCRPDLSDLAALVRYYVSHEEERQAVVREGYAHLLKYHTCGRRAEYFLDLCRGSL
jgi:hypothetical protein